MFPVSEPAVLSVGSDSNDFAFEMSSMLNFAFANVKSLSLVILGVSCGRTEIIRAAPSSRD